MAVICNKINGIINEDLAPAYQQFSSPIRVKNYALSKQSQQKGTTRRRTDETKPLRPNPPLPDLRLIRCAWRQALNKHKTIHYYPLSVTVVPTGTTLGTEIILGSLGYTAST